MQPIRLHVSMFTPSRFPAYLLSTLASIAMLASCMDTTVEEVVDARRSVTDARTPADAPPRTDAAPAPDARPIPDAAPIPDARPVIDAAPLPDAPPPSDHILITQMEVTNETDGFGVLEVEVHMVDATNGVLIGCSGGNHGLNSVDEADVFYDFLFAHFVPPTAPTTGDAPSDTWITLSDIQNRSILLRVYEDDQDPCPVAIGGFDDFIGVTGPFNGSDLTSLTTMSFDDVTVITLGVLP